MSQTLVCPLFPGVDYAGDRASTALKESLQLHVKRSRSLENFSKAPVTPPALFEPQPRSQSGEDHQAEPNPSSVTLKSIHQRPEEHRFDRMMDRFQLRRMSASPGLPLTTRLNTKDHSIVGMTAASAVTEFQDEKKGSRTPLLQRNIVATSMELAFSVAKELPRWTRLVLSTTFPSTSIVTRLRLGALKLVFLVKLLYTPFAIAYDDDEVWANYLDAIVDSIFFFNILATCNTETSNGQGHPITTRRAIWRHYRHNGFFMDLLVALPLEHLLMIVPHTDVVHWVVGFLKLVLQNVSITRHLRIFHAAWSKEVMASDKSAVAWMLFSRYSHLVRIGRIILFIAIVAHYFGCMWSWLHLGSDDDFFAPNDVLAIHMNSIYEALQLLQGQGIHARTTAQAPFGSVAVLLGSIAMAVMFGNVAILVANFSASATAYQRRMERVFAITRKLELPEATRARIH